MASTWMLGALRSTGGPSGLEIVKLGGSLLGMHDWPTRVAELVRERGQERAIVIVVGGGAIVDGLRAIDAAAPQEAALMHGLAIELMGSTAKLVAAALALPLVVEPASVAAGVLDVPHWLAAHDYAAHDLAARLPAGWEVTSDSIAAWVAATTGGDLLLVKSVPPPACTEAPSLDGLTRSGWVDDHFAQAAAALTTIAWAAPRSVPKPGVGGPAGDGGGAVVG
jgi:5-(aminomethyl)-3-furanmethanol phosphate kinase